MKKGEKFRPKFNKEVTYTAKGFLGSTGIEYDTAIEAKKHNKSSSTICIKIEETGGAANIDDAIWLY